MPHPSTDHSATVDRAHPPARTVQTDQTAQTAPETSRETTIRRAGPQDAPALAELFWQVRTESVPHIPMIAHPRESIEPFVRTVLLEEFEVLVAQEGERLVGFLALMPPDVLGHLYLAADHTGRGLGSRLLARACERYPDGLQLWAFQSNTRALRFYERHGFVPVEWTDGDNEEGAPDVRMVWRPEGVARPAQ